MPETEFSFNLAAAYVPAHLVHNCHGYVIEYYTFNASLGVMERHTNKMNRIRKHFKTTREFKVYCDDSITKLNVQLRSGWNPSLTSANKRMFTPMTDVLDKWIRDKETILKERTMISYSTFAHQFARWLLDHVGTCPIYSFSNVLAIEYMDFVDNGGNHQKKPGKKCAFKQGRVSARTYNNNLKMAQLFFSWAISNCYVSTNPFGKIQMKKEQPKSRTTIAPDVRTRIDNYWRENNLPMAIVTRMVYTSLLRPIEVSKLRVAQIHLQEHYVDVSPETAKNGRHRAGRLDDELCELLANHIAGASQTDYVFGAKTWRPGKEHMSSHTFGNIWRDMRNALNLPATIQLYSNRDSGIHDLLEDNVAALDVMQLAGHSDLRQTTRYADHRDPELIRRVNEKVSKSVSR